VTEILNYLLISEKRQIIETQPWLFVPTHRSKCLDCTHLWNLNILTNFIGGDLTHPCPHVQVGEVEGSMRVLLDSSLIGRGIVVHPLFQPQTEVWRSGLLNDEGRASASCCVLLFMNMHHGDTLYLVFCRGFGVESYRCED